MSAEYAVEEITFVYAPKYVDLITFGLNQGGRLPAVVMDIVYDQGGIPATARLRSERQDAWAWHPTYTLSALRPVTDAPARVEGHDWTS